MEIMCKTCQYCGGEWVEEINDIRPYCNYGGGTVDLDDVCLSWVLRTEDPEINPCSSIEDKVKYLLKTHPDTKQTLIRLFPHIVQKNNLEKLHSSELVQERIRHYIMQILRELGRETEVSKVEEIAKLLNND